MKIALTDARTFEGFTYQAGEHEVSDALAAEMLERFPAVCQQVAPPKSTPAAPSAAPEAEAAEISNVEAEEPAAPEQPEVAVVEPVEKTPAAKPRTRAKRKAAASTD